MRLQRKLRWVGLLGCLSMVWVFGQAKTDNPFYGRSYAVAIGIDHYLSSKWAELRHAKKDARGFARFLRSQGFEVTEIYDQKATGGHIKSAIQRLAHRLKHPDRVIIFFSGHGYTERYAGEDFGYIVPHDGTQDSATYISMEELRALSRKLGRAKHQLFILDACFGGLIANRESTAYERSPWPGYLDFVTKNEARQFITAGGKDQRVKDGGPKGYSYFTGFLLEGLTEGKADLYPDGYITFAELAAYLIPRATNAYQTPVSGILPQHGQGQFVFRSPKGSRIGRYTPIRETPSEEETEVGGDQKSPPKPTQDLDAILAKLRARLASRANTSPETKPEEQIKPQGEPASKAGTPRQQSETFKDCDFCSQMVRIPGGCFQMGSPESETGRDDDERLNRVCVEDFRIGKYEVTVGEFLRFVSMTGYRTDAERDVGQKGCFTFIEKDGERTVGWQAGRSWKAPVFPARFQQSDRHPVSCVSWNDAMAYVDWLNRETGKRYRLPTEAEWEYAVRGGTMTARFWGDDPDRACQYANVADRTQDGNWSWHNPHNCEDSHYYAATVGNYKTNEYGLYDMLGNVWEWTCSEYDESYSGKEQKCISKNHTEPRVIRGGSWFNLPESVRSADRNGSPPMGRINYVGFRLLQD
jgi:formylglycine-generating enzyme required for sulfatase activity